MAKSSMTVEQAQQELADARAEAEAKRQAHADANKLGRSAYEAYLAASAAVAQLRDKPSTPADVLAEAEADLSVKLQAHQDGNQAGWDAHNAHQAASAVVTEKAAQLDAVITAQTKANAEA